MRRWAAQPQRRQGDRSGAIIHRPPKQRVELPWRCVPSAAHTSASQKPKHLKPKTERPNQIAQRRMRVMVARQVSAVTNTQSPHQLQRRKLQLPSRLPSYREERTSRQKQSVDRQRSSSGRKHNAKLLKQTQRKLKRNSLQNFAHNGVNQK